MDKKQKIAIAAPPVLVIMMIGVFSAARYFLDPGLAWYAGFWVYWPVCCILFPWWMMGRKRLFALFRHKRLNLPGWGLLLLPPLLTFIGHFIMEYDRPVFWVKASVVLMTFINGPLEEVLWRGVYIELFPNHKLWGFAWPTLWFALWHIAPGTVSPIPLLLLVAGAAAFGVCWGWLALKTGTIRWSAVSHILTGLVRAM